MLEIFLTDSSLLFRTEDLNVLKGIKLLFTFSDASKAISKFGFNKNKIKKICFMKSVEKNLWKLPSGFSADFFNFLKQYSIPFKIVLDKRKEIQYIKEEILEEKISEYFPFNYNDHQIRATKKILKARRGIIVAPTSAGKGDIIATYMNLTKSNTLVLVNQIMLAMQLYSRFVEAGVDCGIHTSDRKEFSEKNMVATIGSINSLDVKKFQTLIIDEVHTASSQQFQDFLDANSFPIQLGFSATPDKGDKYKFALIRQYFGNPIEKIFLDELKDNNVIAKPYIFFIKNENENTIDWPSALVNCLIKNEDRNNKICEIVSNTNRQSAILITDTMYGHGELLKKQIQEKSGKKVVFLTGDSNSKDRMSAIDEYEKGNIDCIIGTSILNQGISIKSIELLINASGGKSNSANLQKLGRSIRSKEGKKNAVIIDFTDEGNVFTQKHSVKRRKIYTDEGYSDIQTVNLDELFEKIEQLND